MISLAQNTRTDCRDDGGSHVCMEWGFDSAVEIEHVQCMEGSLGGRQMVAVPR